MADTKYITLSNLSDFKNQADSLYTTQSELTTAISAAKITIEVNPSTTTDNLSAIGLGGTNYSVYPKDYVSTTALTNTLQNYTLSDTVTSLSSAVTSLTNSYTSLSSTVTSLTNSYTSLSNTITSLTNSYTSLSNTITSVTASVNTLSGSLASLTNSVNTLSNTVAGHTTSISGLSTSVSTLVTSVTTLSNDVATLSAMISGGSVSGSYLPLSGGTLTGDLTLSVNSYYETSYWLTFSNGITTEGSLGLAYLHLSDDGAFYITLEDAAGLEMAAYWVDTNQYGRLLAESDLSTYSLASVPSLITTVSNLSGSYTSLSAALTSATTSIGTLSSNLLSLSSNVTSITSSISSLSNNLSTLSGTVSTISSTVAGHTTSISSLSTSITTNATNISTLSSSVATLLKTASIVSTTYANLVASATAGTLVPGCQYRITDYACTTTTANTQAAGNQFDIIVVADSTTSLNENARATWHSGDTYFASANLNAWELKYSLSNNTDRFKWADSTNGKGVIYYMKDEWNNECPYDFKNIQFKRYKTTDATTDSLLPSFTGRYYAPSAAASDYYTVSSSDYIWCYTFHILDTQDTSMTPTEEPATRDATVYTNSNFDGAGGIYALGDFDFSGLDSLVKNNKIMPYTTSTEVDDERQTSIQALNNIVSFAVYAVATGTTINEIRLGNSGLFFDSDCRNITVEAGSVGCKFGINNFDIILGYLPPNDSSGLEEVGCPGNNFAADCYHIYLDGHCSHNVIGAGSAEHIISKGASWNNFGIYTRSCSLGASCSYNSFEACCKTITLGSSCCYNSFGLNCEKNTLAASCTNNSFGNGCYSNTLGSSCTGNSFGLACYSNSLTNATNNSFGNGCYSNTLVLYNNDNSFGNDCSLNVLGRQCSYNKFGNYCNSNNLGQDQIANVFETNCSSNTLGEMGTSNYFGQGSNNNTLGIQTNYNVFGTACTSNTIGDACLGNVFGAYCTGNSLGDYFQYNTFGSNCTAISFQQSNQTSGGSSLETMTYARYFTIENGCKYLHIQCTSAGSSSSYLQNIHIHEGVMGSSDSDVTTISLDTRAAAYCTDVRTTGDIEVNV